MDSQICANPASKTYFVDRDRFYIGRLLANVALVKVGAVRDLSSAKALMRHTAHQIPGAYIVFDGGTRRVVSKLVSRVRSQSLDLL
jgi:hypothetical protein